jgi:hypothetical protein
MRDRIVDTEFIRAAVRLACRAPSLHNSQPWRWRLDGTAVQLFIDAGWAPSPPIHRAGMPSSVVAQRSIIPGGDGRIGMNRQRRPIPQPSDPDYLTSIDFSAMDFVSDLRTYTDRLAFAAHRNGIRSKRSCSAYRTQPAPGST